MPKKQARKALPARTKAAPPRVRGKRPGKAAKVLPSRPASLPQAQAAKQLAGRPLESESYRRRRLAEGERQRRISASGRDIGPVPAPEDPERREKALQSLALFLLTYAPKIFYLPFSDDHKEVIKAVENVVINGGCWLLIVYRGFGKSGILSLAALWAIANGYRRFVLLLAANGMLAKDQLEDLKTTLTTNELLAADFPDLCFAFRELEGQPGRCRGQTIAGEATGVKWGSRRIVFAQIPMPGGGYYPASGAVLQCSGLMAATRGVVYVTNDGERIRPDLALPDDPQTEASARSPHQCSRRLKIIRQAIAKLAGPDKTIAMVVLGTVIEKGDLVDQLGDRKISPDFFGSRYKLLTQEPTNKELWDKYAEIFIAEMQSGDRDLPKTTAFYKKNLKALWVGAKLSSLHKKEPCEYDALEHAMRWKIRDPNGFACEAQGEPIVEASDHEIIPLDLTILWARISLVPKGQVPLECNILGAGIDVQHSLLYWAACGLNPHQGGAIVDYGTNPDQKRSYFLLREAPYKIKHAYKNHSFEAGIGAALHDLLTMLFSNRWQTPEGITLTLDCVQVDAGEGKVADVVFEVCRKHPTAAGRAQPSIGKGLKATDMPMRLWKGKKGDVYGDHWISRPSEKQGGRYTLIDTNYWKSQLADSLTVPEGDRSAFMMPGVKAGENRLLIDHFCAQKRDRLYSERDGRGIDIWSKKPEKFDDHYWDAARLARVACSVAQFTRLPGRTGARPPSIADAPAKPGQAAASSSPAAVAPPRSRSKCSYPGF